MAKSSDPRLSSRTCSSPTWPTSLPPSGKSAAGMPRVKSGPLAADCSCVMLGFLLDLCRSRLFQGREDFFGRTESAIRRGQPAVDRSLQQHLLDVLPGKAVLDSRMQVQFEFLFPAERYHHLQ